MKRAQKQAERFSKLSPEEQDDLRTKQKQALEEFRRAGGAQAVFMVGATGEAVDDDV
jgi:hypothetical protein